MTYERREEIFSKEVINIQDMMELTGKSYSVASKMIRDMKRKADRLHIDGVIHVLDYFEALGIDPNSPGNRYATKADMKEVTPPDIRATVCVPREVR